MPKERRQHNDSPTQRLVVYFIGGAGMILVCALAWAPYAPQKPDPSITTAICTLVGSLFGYLGGYLQPRNDGQRVEISQPADNPVPVEEINPAAEGDTPGEEKPDATS